MKHNLHSTYHDDKLEQLSLGTGKAEEHVYWNLVSILKDKKFTYFIL